MSAGQVIRLCEPRTNSLSPGIVRIQNREIFASVTATFTGGTSAEKTTSFMLSPTSFNWLGKTVGQYDKYLFSKVNLSFDPLLPTTSGGAILYYFDTSPNDTIPSTYAACSGNFRATTGPIWAKSTHNIMKQALQTQKMFDNRAYSNSQNAFPTCGKLVVALTPITAPSAQDGLIIVGYIWADYVVDMMAPSSSV